MKTEKSSIEIAEALKGFNNLLEIPPREKIDLNFFLRFFIQEGVHTVYVSSRKDIESNKSLVLNNNPILHAFIAAAESSEGEKLFAYSSSCFLLIADQKDRRLPLEILSNMGLKIITYIGEIK